MSRGYPRFLYSNPKNTKSEGPFIVHTLYPRCIFRINNKDKNSTDFSFENLELLDCFDGAIQEDVLFGLKELVRKWIVSQIKIGHIKLFENPYSITIKLPELKKYTGQ